MNTVHNALDNVYFVGHGGGNWHLSEKNPKRECFGLGEGNGIFLFPAIESL